ncbi:hypothetical protein [Modicisalibacter sp. 'Wilcox']|uniref:hypothetical protein n=1 Tax=Modicisalibacter sp. 'Wilcox' TaxID=2679914 RepID=UPI0013CF4CE8|nr:hypothetical protein [Modicisalibacter sp. 'Wilcox']
MKKPVSERAMMARINRKLESEGDQRLRKTRQRWVGELGSYHLVDENLNTVAAHHIESLEEFAAEIGVIKPFEEVVYGK